jgi:hypothetical protein
VRRLSDRRARRGQSLVEFAILVPAFMIVIFGMLEFGMVFSHHLSLEYATREGARVGSALGSGTTQAPCVKTGSLEPVDWLIIAAVQRVLSSPGSPVVMGNVTTIHIYKADTNGNETSRNIWSPGNVSGQSVDGVALQFHETSHGWDCSTSARKKSPIGSADSLGVSLTYTYNSITPIGALLRWSGNQLTITDRTVMAINPFQDP